MYNGSQVLTADMSLVYSSNYKDSLLEDSQKSRGVFMDSEIDHNLAQNQQSSSGLLRFRSAPSSLLVNFTNACASAKLGDSLEGFLSSPGFQDFKGNSREKLAADGTIVDQRRGPQSGYAGGSDPQLPPHYPRQSSVSKGGSICSNLSRQSSSPPGLFKNPTAQNGYAAMRGLGNGRVGGGDGEGANGEPSPSASRLKGQISYLSGLPSSLGLLSQISELGSESIAASSRDGGKIGNIEGSNQFYSPGISFGSWSGSAGFQENFNCVKRDPDDDGKLFSRNGELGNGMQVLSHHLSLLKTPAEITAMDKFLQFSDSVPCKVRAKRGCATHPRSIAERVRRSRISERMRKLQDLVPNMEKQTNTADMLDLAVEYIKNLQRQYKALSSNLANCKCSGLQTTVANDIV